MRFLSDLCRRHEGIYRVHWAALRRSAMLNESSVISLFHQRQETEGIRIYNSLAPLSCWSHKEGNACQPNPPRLLWLVLHHSICKCQLCTCSAHAKRTKRRGKWASIFFSWWSGPWTRKSGVSQEGNVHTCTLLCDTLLHVHVWMNSTKCLHTCMYLDLRE